MGAPLTPYELYYQTTGLAEYERVFKFNDELDTEVKIYISLMRRWPGCSAPRLRILDIGCGLGTFTSKFLERFCAEHSDGSSTPFQVDADLVDLNPTAFAEYANRLGALAGVKVHVGRTVCESWLDVGRHQLGPAYDLVIANHCFYGALCSPALIRSLTNLLAPGGLALLALASQHSDIFRMRREAGVRINSAEDLERALLSVNCNFSRAAYESDFNFDPASPLFLNWLFATATADASDRDKLLGKYSQRGSVRPFIVNRALIHVVEPETLPLEPI